MTFSCFGAGGPLKNAPNPLVFEIEIMIATYVIYAFALKFSLVTHNIMLLEKCLAPY